RVLQSQSSKCCSLFPMVNVSGVLTVAFQEGSFDQEDFEDFLEHGLVSTLDYAVPQVHHAGA
ncbi:hypothetical protein CROQUDRAFT_54978, partial [Cronartium quercuum f. sp. fusiforme G11]